MQDNWEVEQKFVVVDPEALRRNLTHAGFEVRCVEEHCDVYFRHPCRDFRATDEAFRLRTVDDHCCLTYKGKRLQGKVKTRPEIELAIGYTERERWRQMIELLGFSPLPAVQKRRQVYIRREDVEGQSAQPPQFAAGPPDAEGLQVVLDEVQQLGNFAEIELIVTDAEKLAEAQQQIMQLADLLALGEVQPRSYLSQLLSKLETE